MPVCEPEQIACSIFNRAVRHFALRQMLAESDWISKNLLRAPSAQIFKNMIDRRKVLEDEIARLATVQM